MIIAETGLGLLAALRLQHPEWRPLLALIEAALAEVERPEWRVAVPATPALTPGVEPQLSSAFIRLDRQPVERWVRRVLGATAGLGPGTPFAGGITSHRIEPISLFEAAVAQDGDRLNTIARGVGDAHGVLRGLTTLIAMPLLQACRRAWTDWTARRWPHGYCPVCGAWPTLAEIRGLDGARHLRCPGCGGDWATKLLRCPFCGEHDHARLGSLVSADRTERERIEFCDRFRGYLKTITTFAAIRPEHVMLHDLATVVLDVAAVERDYRPPSPRGPVPVRIVARRSGLRVPLSR